MVSTKPLKTQNFHEFYRTEHDIKRGLVPLSKYHDER